MQLLDFLLKTVSFSENILSSFFASGIQGCPPESRKTFLQKNSLWEIQTTAFTMISEVFSRVGTSLQPEHWESTVDVSILLHSFKLVFLYCVC